MKNTLCLAMALALVLALAGLTAAEQPTPKPEPELVGNKICPVSGNPVGGSADNPTFFFDHKGYRIGFMCPMCRAKFKKADDAAKLELLNKALVSVGKPPVK